MKLSELLRTYRDREQTTWADMAARATQQGYPITRQYFSTIAKHGLKEVPGSDIIRAIAVATREDPNVIYLAAGEELGFRTTGPFVLDDPAAKAFLALTADRTPEEIEHLLETVRVEARRLTLYRQPPVSVTDVDKNIGQAGEDE